MNIFLGAMCMFMSGCSFMIALFEDSENGDDKARWFIYSAIGIFAAILNLTHWI